MSTPVMPAAEPSSPVLSGARSGSGLLVVVVGLVAILTALLRLLIG